MQAALSELLSQFEALTIKMNNSAFHLEYTLVITDIQIKQKEKFSGETIPTDIMKKESCLYMKKKTHVVAMLAHSSLWLERRRLI